MILFYHNLLKSLRIIIFFLHFFTLFRVFEIVCMCVDVEYIGCSLNSVFHTEELLVLCARDKTKSTLFTVVAAAATTAASTTMTTKNRVSTTTLFIFLCVGLRFFLCKWQLLIKLWFFSISLPRFLSLSFTYSLSCLCFKNSGTKIEPTLTKPKKMEIRMAKRTLTHSLTSPTFSIAIKNLNN